MFGHGSQSEAFQDLCQRTEVYHEIGLTACRNYNRLQAYQQATEEDQDKTQSTDSSVNSSNRPLIQESHTF